MAANAAINTPSRPGKVLYLPLAAATIIYAGTLVAVNTAGNAVPASDTTLLVVVGRAEQTVDNSAGAAGDLSINVEKGVFRYPNSATNAVDPDDKGKWAYVEDDQTVAETSAHKVKAGRVIDVDADGVWIDVSANTITQVDTITGAADLTALKVALVALLNHPGVSLIK
jgi:predicted RecA/RadA family phage recombinase